MENEKKELNKIKYFQEKVQSIDEQILELVSERFRTGDKLSNEIFKNNIDLNDKFIAEKSLRRVEQEDDETIQNFMKYLYDICEKRYNYVSDKFNSKYASLGVGSGFRFTKEIYSEILNEEYYHFARQDNLLENLLSRNNFRGLSIGNPYKTEIIKFLDDTTNQVKEIGEANLIQFHKGRKYGFNTEYFGILKLFEKKNIILKDKSILILKSKESTKTIEYVVGKLNPRHVEIIDINELNNNQFKAEILINTVETDTYNNIDLNNIEGLKNVVDLTYKPYYSNLYLDAKLNNIEVVNGLFKNVYQVKKNMEILLRKRYDDHYFETLSKEIIKKDMNIVLVGMPGAGKTTIGRKLGKLLDREHYDLDREFKNEYGISSSDFLRYESEIAFREKEHEVVKKLTKKTGLILSTSGGVVNKEENYYYLKKNSVIFRVDRDLNQLSTRNRPLSQGGIETLIKMYEDRSDKYDYFTDYVVKNYGDFHNVAYRIKEIFENMEIE